MNNIKKALIILMTESFSLREVSHSEIEKHGDLYFVYFKHEDKKNYEIKVEYRESNTNFSFYIKIGDKWIIKPSESDVKFSRMLSFYSELFFVIMYIVKELKITNFKIINAEDSQLDTYNAVFNNRFFRKIFEDEGFTLSHNNVYYKFDKVDNNSTKKSIFDGIFN